MAIMANNELIREEVERPIKNSAGRAGLNWLYTKNYRVTTNWSKLSTNYNLFMQNEPNFQKVKFNVSKEMKKDYEKKDTWWNGKNEPKTNPNEPNQSQFAKCSNDRN